MSAHLSEVAAVIRAHFYETGSLYMGEDCHIVCSCGCIFDTNDPDAQEQYARHVASALLDAFGSAASLYTRHSGTTEWGAAT